MSIFKKKKEEEVINIDLIKQENQTPDKFSMKTPNQPVTKSVKDYKKYIFSELGIIEYKNENLYKEYYICKILSRVKLSSDEFISQTGLMDNNINKLSKNLLDYKVQSDRIRFNEELDDNIVYETYQLVRQLSAFQLGLFEQIKECNNIYYGHLKMSTVSVVMNKNLEELQTLYTTIDNELKGYNSLQEKAEYIYFHSGEMINEVINSFINSTLDIQDIKNSKLYTFNYYLSSDVVVTLEAKEWIELYKKLKFALRTINIENVRTKQFKKLFNIFEAKYAILMLYLETPNARFI